MFMFYPIKYMIFTMQKEQIKNKAVLKRYDAPKPKIKHKRKNMILTVCHTPNLNPIFFDSYRNLVKGF